MEALLPGNAYELLGNLLWGAKLTHGVRLRCTLREPTEYALKATPYAVSRGNTAIEPRRSKARVLPFVALTDDLCDGKSPFNRIVHRYLTWRSKEMKMAERLL
jgi:hypothetical protein